ncbi:MAG: DUF2125 domain-containing protein [Alphaproteobacteria bacterium]|jgi:hypothetical protein|nr:DUF2125 domain-containing protein [Rhodospirillaceae bacterium]MBT6205746.1 DUF2125 domain-containing protein [Rhodospirillaceae bacterium]MBT7648862.1 DUF2125 domain-containing protein [Rhodospirillaceae bacterium]MDG2481574.1 DUF2125 domain-containing protein [Alphaproteobacteria bacterium]
MRRALIATLAVLVMLVVAYIVYWNVMASRSDEWVAYWAAPAPGKAWHATYSTTEVTGFPFALDIRVRDPVITWQERSGESVWQGPFLIARFKPWTLASFAIELPSEQTLQIDDGERLRMLSVTMDSGSATIGMDDGRMSTLHAAFRRIVVWHELNQPPVTADGLTLDYQAVEEEPAHDVSVVINGLGLAGNVVPPFDAVIPHVSTTLRWVGDLPDQGSLAGSLEAWRLTGGVIEVTDLKLDWPPLDVAADGTLALDSLLRPIGAFRADVVGYRDLLEAMEKAGSLEPGQAVVAGTALDIMAQRQDDGRKRLAVDVSIQNGMLSVGPIPVYPVGPVIPAEAGF